VRGILSVYAALYAEAARATGREALERGGELPLREAALYLAENIYSLTDYQRPWVNALELFGVGAGDPVTVRTRMWH
jgi:hypothetical protein